MFDGELIARIPAREFHKSPQRRDIQIVFQDPNDSLNPRYTAFDSIAHPLRRLEGLRDGRGPRGRACATPPARAGLPMDLLERFPHQLSGGQKARVGIARAIAPRPRLHDPRRADGGARRVGAGRDPAVCSTGCGGRRGSGSCSSATISTSCACCATISWCCRPARLPGANLLLNAAVARANR